MSNTLSPWEHLVPPGLGTCSQGLRVFLVAAKVYWGSCVLSIFSVRPICGKFPASAHPLGQCSLCDRIIAQCWEYLAFHHPDVQCMLLARVSVDSLKSTEFWVWVRLIYASGNVLLGEAACF